MPKYWIEQFELHAQEYWVEAASPAEAIAKLFHGEATPADEEPELIEVADDFGLPADQHRELAEELRRQGICRVDDVIPAIRRITEDS